MLKISKKEIQTLRSILKKLEEQQNHEKIRIKGRIKAQKQGKTITRTINKRNKPIREKRRVTKKRSSIP